MKENNLKKITIVDKIKTFLKTLVRYTEGKKFIIDTEPNFKEYSDIELMKLATSEEKLKKAIAENKNNKVLTKGINKNEAEELLEWIVQNARKTFIEVNNTELTTASLQGFCGFGQAITARTLQNMGLSPNTLNVNPTLNNQTGGHAFLTVEIPIIQGDGRVEEIPYLVDTTFRQFCQREEILPPEGEYIKDKRFGNKVAPLAGYWILQMPEGKHFAETILSQGYIELTEENAKIYGDSFILETLKRKNYTKVPKKKELETGISGKTYIKNMFNPINVVDIDFEDEEFEELKVNLKTPGMLKSEIKSQEQNNQDTTITRTERNDLEK